MSPTRGLPGRPADVSRHRASIVLLGVLVFAARAPSQTYRVLHSFDPQVIDAQAALIADPAGNFHGTAPGGTGEVGPIVPPLLTALSRVTRHVPDRTLIPAKFGLSEVRSVTFFPFPNVSDQKIEYEKLMRVVPAIKAAGFNTVWLVNPIGWTGPSALVRDYGGLVRLQAMLHELQNAGLHVILGMPYSIPCGWSEDRTMREGFFDWANWLLGNLIDYADNMLVPVFTETADPGPCNPQMSWAERVHSIQRSIGSLPGRLDPEVRARFRIGYHDGAVTANGWRGVAPTERFDFVSTGAYCLDDMSDAEIRQTMQSQERMMAEMYPGLPVFWGEFGASAAFGLKFWNGRHSLGPGNQARVIGDAIRYTGEMGRGLNIWGWGYETDNPDLVAALLDLGIHNPDGSDRPVMAVIRDEWGR